MRLAVDWKARLAHLQRQRCALFECSEVLQSKVSYSSRIRGWKPSPSSVEQSQSSVHACPWWHVQNMPWQLSSRVWREKQGTKWNQAKQHSQRNERHPGICRCCSFHPIISKPLFKPLLQQLCYEQAGFGKLAERKPGVYSINRQVAINRVVVAPFCQPPSGQSSEVLQPKVSLLSFVKYGRS